MKKIILFIAIAMFSYCSDAQTNTFPSSGNVDIGTTSPGSDLNVFETTDSKPGKHLFIGAVRKLKIQ